jgi:hypothetical protein
MHLRALVCGYDSLAGDHSDFGAAIPGTPSVLARTVCVHSTSPMRASRTSSGALKTGDNL